MLSTYLLIFQLMCRTAIALEQEKVIEQNSKEIFHIKEKADELLKEIEKMRKEHERLISENENGKRTLSEKEEIIKNNNTGKTMTSFLI